MTYQEQLEAEEMYHGLMDQAYAEDSKRNYDQGVADAATFKAARSGDPDYKKGYMHGISLLPSDPIAFQNMRSQYKRVKLPSFVNDEF